MAMLATIAPKDGLDQIPLLAESGAWGIKVSLFNTDSVRFPKIDEGESFSKHLLAIEKNRTTCYRTCRNRCHRPEVH